MEIDYTRVYRRVAEEFVRRIDAQSLSFVRSIVLFGSVARGTADPDSDLDVLLTLHPDTVENRESIQEIVLDVQLEFQAPLSVKIYGLDQVNALLAKRAPFMTSVMKEGEVLWPRK